MTLNGPWFLSSLVETFISWWSLFVNVLVYRKDEGQLIWLARVRPEHCEGIVKYTILQGKVVHPEFQLRGGFDKGGSVTSW